MSKLIVIVGVTGNQGGSVARKFVRDTSYRVRGLTRTTNSAAAVALAEQGIEIVAADLDDVNTLIPAFAGANLIFSVTNYWEPFFRPDYRSKAAELGISCRKLAYDVELRQGKNIADAAALTVESLDENGFTVSTRSHAGHCSRGSFKELYHFDAKADVFPGYVKEVHPALEKKMSCVQTGYFMSSYKLLPKAYFSKLADGTFQTSFPTRPNAVVPHFVVNADMGNFVYAVSKLPPGRSYVAAGTFCTWAEFARTWGNVTNQPAEYRQVTIEEFAASTDPDFGAEARDVFAYSSDPGYDGGDKSLWTAKEITEAGVECRLTTLEEFMRGEDWSIVLG